MSRHNLDMNIIERPPLLYRDMLSRDGVAIAFHQWEEKLYLLHLMMARFPK